MNQPENSNATAAAEPIIEVKPWMTISADEIKGDLFKARLRQAGIPKKFLDKSLNGFTADTKPRKEVVKAARDYISYFCTHKGEQIDGVKLEGSVGSGKTHVALGMLREIIAQGYTGLYCNVPEFLKEIRSTYGATSGPDESELIDETRDVDILVLDDLGVEGRILDPIRDKSKWLCDRLYLVINGRYETDKPIIMTTNCTLEALKEQFDERTISRLAEMTRRHFPAFPNNDYRMEHLKSA
ncbi:MAG: ATP-binding protein [Candidatus Sumerlaeota bacterium]|nr:ATP-binding protein [Candidatus Sumerlaeota bacterium]